MQGNTFRRLAPSEAHARWERRVLEHPSWQENPVARFNATGATIGCIAAVFISFIPLIGWIIGPLLGMASLIYLMLGSGMIEGSKAARLKEAEIARLESEAPLIFEGVCPLCQSEISLPLHDETERTVCPECGGALLFENGAAWPLESARE
jgi:hypothetical protein